MFRFLLLLALILYVIYKIGSLFFRAGAASQQLRNQQRKDFEANASGKNNKSRHKEKFKGGEYIDYEEVK